MASPMVLNEMPCSASPGMGISRATEPIATTSTSYSMSSSSPGGVSTTTFFSAWEIFVTRAVSTWQRLSARRSGTTTCRGSIAPAAAPGRHGRHGVWGGGSTTVTAASPPFSLRCRPSAVYIPTYPPPSIRILAGVEVPLPMSPWWHLYQGNARRPGVRVVAALAVRPVGLAVPQDEHQREHDEARQPGAPH